MNKHIDKIVLTGLFIAIGIVLPPLFHGAGLGPVISPMHFPVLLCGLMLGWKYGVISGIVTPILVSFMFGVPPLFPVAIVMSIELATYGLVGGALFASKKMIRYEPARLYLSLIIAMILGRVVYGLVYALMFVLDLSTFAFSTYLTTMFVTGLPGIVLQILIVPAVVMALKRHEASENVIE